MAHTQNALPEGDWFAKEIKYTNVLLTAGVGAPLPATALTNRREIWVQNDSGASIFLSHSSTGTAAQGQGWELANGEEEKLKLDAGVILYAVSVAAGWVSVLEFA